MTIGITARNEAGKTTVAKAISKEAAAKGLKAEVFEISGYILKEAIGSKAIVPKERSELSYAEIGELIRIGNGRRAENPNYWTNMLAKDIARIKPDVALIPNIRFINEANIVRKMDGYIVRVKSLVVDGVEYISTSRNPNDISEVEQHSIQADYFLTVKRGESLLLAKQAVGLFNYLIERKANA